MKHSFFLLFIGLLVFHSSPAQVPDLGSDGPSSFQNFSALNDSIYRSEQPRRKGFAELEAIGIKTVINFRRRKDDTRKAKGTTIQLERIPLKAAELTEAEILHVLRVIQHAEKPVLIHCWKGSDRTGAISAAYRIVLEGWSNEKAVRELRTPAFGHNERLYPNVVELLLHLDGPKLRRELGIR